MNVTIKEIEHYKSMELKKSKPSKYALSIYNEFLKKKKKKKNEKLK